MGTTTPNLGLRKPDSIEVVNVETDINDNMDILDTAIQDLRVPAQGKLWRTAGFTGALAAAGTAIAFDASRVLGGMTTGVNGDGLVVPVSGMYDVTINGYGSGGGAAAQVRYSAYRVRAATPDRNVCIVSMAKTNADDVSGSFTDTVPLQAGDEIRAKGFASDSAVNGWGVDEVSGVRLLVKYRGPLSGQTPV